MTAATAAVASMRPSRRSPLMLELARRETIAFISVGEATVRDIAVSDRAKVRSDIGHFYARAKVSVQSGTAR
jgi:hypothetical protein